MQLWKKILAAFLVLLVVARVAAPSVILKKINSSLAQLEGPFCGHVDDFDLALIRGTYRLEGLSIRAWNERRTECKDPLLTAEKVEISLAWGALLQGKARVKISAAGADLKANEFLAAIDKIKEKPSAQEAAKAGAKETFETLVPWRIDAVRIAESKVTYQLLGAKGITAPLSHVEAEVTGISSKEDAGMPILFRAKGNVFQDAPLVISGSVALDPKGARWETDFNLRKLNLTEANAFLKDRLPMTFTSGSLNIFGEAAGKGAFIEGYTRLLFSNIDVISSKEKWGSFKRGLVEVVTALFFEVTKNQEKRDVATELVLKGNAPDISVDWVGALTRTLQHANGLKIPEGIDNRLELPKP
jgi:hypothetical protein